MSTGLGLEVIRVQGSKAWGLGLRVYGFRF